MVKYLWLCFPSFQSDSTMSEESGGDHHDSDHLAHPQLVPPCVEMADGSANASPNEMPEPNTSTESTTSLNSC